jgi:ATPase, YjeE family
MRVMSSSAPMTRAIGAAIASVLEPGAVVVLAGDLGTGKTVLAQGVAAALGVTERVVSPTFAIAREYQGRVPVHHLDVYRLDHVQEAIDLGLDELFEGAVTLIEWGDGVRDLLPAERLEVELDLLPPDEADDDTRVIAVTPFGAYWLSREPALTAALAAAVGTRS